MNINPCVKSNTIPTDNQTEKVFKPKSKERENSCAWFIPVPNLEKE